MQVLSIKVSVWLYYDQIDDFGNLNQEMIAKMVVASIEGPHLSQAEIISNYERVATIESEIGSNPQILARTSGEPFKATGYKKVRIKNFTKRDGPDWLPKLAEKHYLKHMVLDGKLLVTAHEKEADYCIAIEFKNVSYQPVQLEMIDPINKVKKTVTGKKCFLEYEENYYYPGNNSSFKTINITFEGETGFDENYLLHETLQNWAKLRAKAAANIAISTFPIETVCLKVSEMKKNKISKVVINIGKDSGIQGKEKGTIYYLDPQTKQKNEIGSFVIKDIMGNKTAEVTVKFKKYNPQPEEIINPDLYYFMINEWKKKGLF